MFPYEEIAEYACSGVYPILPSKLVLIRAGSPRGKLMNKTNTAIKVRTSRPLAQPWMYSEISCSIFPRFENHCFFCNSNSLEARPGKAPNRYHHRMSLRSPVNGVVIPWCMVWCYLVAGRESGMTFVLPSTSSQRTQKKACPEIAIKCFSTSPLSLARSSHRPETCCP